MSRVSVSFISCACSVLALIGTASAQTTNATIVGDVTDPNGGRIASAVIKVTNSATGVAREVATNELGSYRVFPLNPGTYEVTASAPGFSTQIQDKVVLDAAANVKVDFKLEVGVVSEKVQVEATATVLQTQDASVGGTVTGNEVARLPVNGRNYTRLILLMPGTSDQGGSQSNGTFSGTQMISVNGQRRQDNNFTVDGIDNNFMMMNSPGMSPSMDAIQEFRVLDNTSAEFGRSSGSNVNIVIKSGTRNLHGSAYEYLRNDKFDANDFFANKQNTGKVPFRQNQYGVAAGGPVIIPKIYHGRDRTFWFFNWEGYRARRGQTNISSFPTAAERAGDFTALSKTLYDPFTGVAGPNGSIIRQPFAGNIIPTSMTNPAMKFWLDTMIPLPTGPGLTNNFVNTQGYSNDRDAFQVRGDHNIGTRNLLSLRWSRQRVGQNQPGGNPYLSQVSRFDVDNMMVSWNHIFSPTTVLELKFGRNVPTLPQPPINTKIQRQDFLAKAGITMFIPDVLFNPLPNFSADGEFSAGIGGQITGDHIYQYIASFNKVVGRHSLKFGANYSRRHFSTNTTNPMDGSVDFDPSTTNLQSNPNSGDSFASLLLGLPSAVRRGTGNTKTEAQINVQTYYAQDDWRVSNRLTVNLGLRYEAIPAPLEDTNRLGNLLITRDPNTGKYSGTLLWATTNPEVDPATGVAGEPAHTGGYGRSLMRNNYLDFAPRVGLAYQINNKTVVRSAYGIFYNSTFVQELQDMRKFWPYTIQQNFSANQGVVPDLKITDPGPSFQNTSAIGGWPQNPNNRTPYSEQWNLTVQRQLMDDMTLDVGYVGNVNKRQVGYDPINSALTPGPGPIQPRRLLPDFGDLDGGNNKFTSQYNSMRVNLVKRFSRGLQLDANYTWGRAMTNSSSLAEATVQNPYNLRSEWERASIDLRHIFQLAYVYELPFGHGRKFGAGWSPVLNAILGGWSGEGITRAQTGAPLNPRINQDRANVGRTYQRPDATGISPDSGPKTIDQWFNVAAFALPAPYTYGSSGAFVITAPGRYNWDLALQKDFRIREAHTLQFRAESYNLPNSVSPGNPNTAYDGNNFGVITSATSARQLQFALRYSF
jgi:Carboxypeptidase regulatory-like domain/TonB dependent receptor-like, beta-barrel